MSSPYLNNLIIVGSILVYVAGIMFGLDADISGTGCMVSSARLGNYYTTALATYGYNTATSK